LVGPIYLIRAVLYDQQGLHARKDFLLNVTLNYSDPEVAVVETKIETEVIGRII
jgi:hypothetical protein